MYNQFCTDLNPTSKPQDYFFLLLLLRNNILTLALAHRPNLSLSSTCDTWCAWMQAVGTVRDGDSQERNSLQKMTKPDLKHNISCSGSRSHSWKCLICCCSNFLLISVAVNEPESTLLTPDCKYMLAIICKKKHSLLSELCDPECAA